MDLPASVLGREEEPIARHLPLRASPGAFERWVEVGTEADLVAVVRAARAEKLAVRVVPPFTDALPPEGGLGGLALRLGGEFEQLRRLDDGRWEVGVSVPVALLGLQRGWTSLAFGGGVVGDALEDGWLAPHVLHTRRFRGRSVEAVEGWQPEPKALPLKVVLPAEVKVVPTRAGTAFAEPGRRTELRALLRRSGLTTVRLHDAALADDDPAVLLNRGDASPRQLRLLMQAVRDRVHVATGFELTERLAAPGRGGKL